MKNIDKIIFKYLSDGFLDDWSKIPPRARLLMVPLDKLKKVSGRSIEDLKKEFDSVMTDKIPIYVFASSLEDLKKLKIITKKEEQGTIKIELTSYGSKLLKSFDDYLNNNSKPITKNVTYSKQDKKELEKMYSMKPGRGSKWTGD